MLAQVARQRRPQQQELQPGVPLRSLNNDACNASQQLVSHSSVSQQSARQQAHKETHLSNAADAPLAGRRSQSSS